MRRAVQNNNPETTYSLFFFDRPPADDESFLAIRSRKLQRNLIPGKGGRPKKREELDEIRTHDIHVDNVKGVRYTHLLRPDPPSS